MALTDEERYELRSSRRRFLRMRRARRNEAANVAYAMDLMSPWAVIEALRHRTAAELEADPPPPEEPGLAAVSAEQPPLPPPTPPSRRLRDTGIALNRG